MFPSLTRTTLCATAALISTQSLAQPAPHPDQRTASPAAAKHEMAAVAGGSSAHKAPIAQTTNSGSFYAMAPSTSSAIAALTGAVPRTLSARLADEINVKDFGAKGDGIYNDSASFNAAFSVARATLATRTAKIIIPAGRYVLDSTWNSNISTSYDFAVVGAGAGVTTLVFNGTDGFDVSGGVKSVIFSGMDILTGDKGIPYAHTGISIVGPKTGTSFPAPKIENVTFADSLNDFMHRSHGWATAMNFVTTLNASVHNVRVEMPDWAPGITQGVGIHFEGQGFPAGFGPWSIDNSLSSFYVLGGYAAVTIGKFTQGLSITNSAFVGNDYGINWDGTYTDDSAELVAVTNTEFNDHTSGILLSKVALSQVTGNQFMHFLPNLTEQWSAIDFEDGAGYSTITGNTITGQTNINNSSAVYPEYGIIVNNSQGSPVSVTGNIGIWLGKHLIWFKGNTQVASAAGNSVNGTTLNNSVIKDDRGNNGAIGNVYNGNPPPIFDDGVNISIRTHLLFPLPGKQTAYIGASGDGGLYAWPNLTVAGHMIATRYSETLYTPPSSASQCTTGQFADDANYHYVCIDTNRWKRVALSGF